MPFAAALVMLVLFFLSAGALTTALVISRHTRMERERRVNLIGAMPVARAAALAEAAAEPVPRVIDSYLRRWFTVGTSRTWGMKDTAIVMAIFALVAGAVVWIVMHTALGVPTWVTAPITAFAAFMMPRVHLLQQQRQAETEFTDYFPDAVIAIARMLRAGLPITSAVRSVSTEAAPPVNSIFRMLSDQIEIGTPIEAALEATSRKVGLQDFRFFTVAVVLQHATGGNLAATLEILADIVRKRRAARLKAKATTAEIRVSAYVLGSLPLLIIAALAVIQPGYLAPLFTDPRGHVIIGVAFGLLVAAGVTMRQMMRSVTKM